MTASKRRLGTERSASRASLMDAVEAVMREHGYGALTARRVAERAGLKHQLVYYYFQTMEELIVETFRRLAIRDLDRMRVALSGHHSLREIWEVCIQTADTRMVQEFMALANRIEALRSEVQEYIETSRKMHVDALAGAMRNSGLDKVMSAEAAAIFGAAAALAVHREAQVGVTMGHADVMAVIDKFIARLDPLE